MTGPGDAHAEEVAALVGRRISERPVAAVVLGSGLGGAAAAMEAEAEIPFTDLPGFPKTSVPGHEGRLVVGRLAGVQTAAFLGRLHHYEGHPMSLVTLPVRAAAALGARTLIVTGAVGSLDPALAPGSLVVATDHINFMGENPLRGWRDDEGRPPFVDLADVYDPKLAELALSAAADEGLPAARGVYAGVGGPTYETRAELAFLRGAGATVVGMSVVPEACAAAALGMRCLGLSCVTNAAGAGARHEEVVRVAAGFAAPVGRLLARILTGL